MPSGNHCGAHCLRPGRFGQHCCQGWRPMCSDVSSLSDWMCSRCLFDRTLERPRVDIDVLFRNKMVLPLRRSGIRGTQSLCGSRTDANKASQNCMTTLRTIVPQRLEGMMATCNPLDIAGGVAGKTSYIIVSGSLYVHVLARGAR